MYMVCTKLPLNHIFIIYRYVAAIIVTKLPVYKVTSLILATETLYPNILLLCVEK